MTADDDFERFFTERLAAAEAFVHGDVGPALDLTATEGAASFHSPDGKTLSGAASVRGAFEWQSHGFHGGESRFDILQKGVSGDLGFWTGVQVVAAKMQRQDQTLDMRIRVTEVFQRIGDAWKLVHGYADMGARS